MSATATRAPGNTRRKILQAAFDEFHRHGFQGGSVNQIVESAGTTKGALFHHFGNKNELGYAVVNELIEPRIKQRWFDPLAESVDPIADLKRLLRQAMKEDVAEARYVQGCPLNNLAQEMSPLDEGFRQCINKVYCAWRESIAAALTRGIKAGTVRKNVSPRRVAAFIVAAQAGIVGTAKNAQCEKLMQEAGGALLEYLDGLKA